MEHLSKGVEEQTENTTKIVNAVDDLNHPIVYSEDKGDELNNKGTELIKAQFNIWKRLLKLFKLP